MKESKIFKNRDALSPHFVPNNLLFRDKQINGIANALTPSLRGDRGRNLFIYGKTGTGKTSCMRYVIDKIKAVPGVKAQVNYINCRIYNSRYRILQKIMSDYMPTYAKHGYGVVDLYNKMISWIEEDGKILVPVLDEIDVVRDLDDMVYTLTRANSDIKSGGIVIVGISNKISFKDDLDPRSLSTLYETELVFPPYNSTELSEILKQRAAIGLRDGVIDSASINLLAAISAKDSGDARIALKMLAKAAEMAEERGDTKVNSRDIDNASRSTEDEVAYELVSTLPEHQKLVIYAISLLVLNGSRYKRLMDGGDGTYLISGDVYDKYVAIVNSLSKEPKSTRWYRKFVADLEMQALISTVESGKGIRGHTKLIKLLYSPAKIKETIEQGLFKEMEAEGRQEAADIPG
jgi:cell division control protein 6